MRTPRGPHERPAARVDVEAVDFKHEIASDVAITGKINFPGDARIDGRLKGEVRADALLLVGETGVLHANVRADRLVVAGTLHGNVQRARLVELLPGARLIGNVDAERIAVHPGALLHGRCRVGPREAAPGEAPNVIVLDRPIQVGAQRR